MKKTKSDEKAERDLMALYASREELIEGMKLATPDRIAEGQALLRQIDADIELREQLEADVQEKASEHEKALRVRRKTAIDLLAVLDGFEKEPTFPKAAFDMIPTTRAKTLRFLRLDAEERGIADDDH